MAEKNERARVETGKESASIRRQRKKRKAQQEYVHYQVRVSDWSCYYSLRVNDSKGQFDAGPHRELVTLSFSGQLEEPDSIKYRKAELTLSAREKLAGETWQEPPASIGSLSTHKDTLSAYVFVPVEHFAMLVSLANSGKVWRVSLVGSRLRYRSGTIQHISIDTSSEENGCRT